MTLPELQHLAKIYHITGDVKNAAKFHKDTSLEDMTKAVSILSRQGQITMTSLLNPVLFQNTLDQSIIIYPEWYLKLDQEEQQELIQCFIRICETIYAASLTDYYTITKQFQEESFILIYEITDKRLFKNQLLYIIYRIRHYKDGAIPYSIIFGYFQDHPDFGYRGKNNFLQILEIELNNKDQFLKVCRAKQNHIQGSAMPMMILCQKLLDKWNK